MAQRYHRPGEFSCIEASGAGIIGHSILSFFDSSVRSGVAAMGDFSHLSLHEIDERGIAVLRVTASLRLEDRPQFSFLSEQLMYSDQPKRVIDLSRAAGLFSVYYGSLVDLSQRAVEDGSPLTILVNDRILDLFTKAGLAKTLPLVPVKVPVA